MTELRRVQEWLEERMPRLLEKYHVPGAAWGVLQGPDIVDGASGLLNTSTGVEATADSVFQIGSITKLWTATMVLQLVDEGRVDLDAPVRTYLPSFRIADEEAATRITVRQLLSHTAGFEGDVFTDTGVGDDCVEKYVECLRDVPQLFPPGERFSYNNAGYCVLGRLVEVLRDQPYDACLREHLFAPLGLTHAATGPYEAILFRAAVGHVETETGAGHQPAPVWAMARSNAPAGSMLAMRPRDLLTFARMHLDDGRAADGTPVLAPGTAGRMRAHQVDLPPLGLMGTSWGLGFERFDNANRTIVGHDGTTIGQSAFLRMVPEAGVAVALLTNGGDVVSLYRDVVGHVLSALAGTSLAELPVPPARPRRVDASRYAGTYSAEVFDLTVTQDDDGRIWIEQVPKGVFAEQLGGKVERTELVHYRDDMLIPLEPDRGMHMPHAFVGDDGAGRALYLHLGRVVRRAGA
ncbi:CubicO group peptidase (beta-lactamase class C family) [Prauserella shujinwangii]|uniref:CubicO group peptidase (Beta-lactamase class C family) n=1 Tax=Prauserella shujinwangii TaxID=1453103 RepID=A0A2T0LT96_9PSEU|nr:serine hydrolase domain-containing protein [Prauserella shujinwangii]PRX46914.1 CubicO group peptidase (beta-lactamase class C family) [Prauserella shujinwangii]